MLIFSPAKQSMPLCRTFSASAGDFVDRGSWGLEVLLVLLTLKVADPQSIFLLRGNHEGYMCTQVYGFQGELLHKFKGLPKIQDRKPAKAVLTACLGTLRLRAPAPQ
jgi:serine/threonine-protein phosphatase 5